jgi:hypothetical protein
MAITNYRQQLRAAGLAILTRYKADVTQVGTLAHVYNHKPPSPRVPCAYLEKHIPEPGIRFDAQLRQRELILGVVVLLRATNVKESTEETDVIAEELIDYFTRYNREVPEARMVPESLDDPIEEQFGTATYLGFRLNVRGSIQQGRNF